MRRMLIAGNWKMHGDRVFVSKLLEDLKQYCKARDDLEWLVCPPFVFLSQAEEVLRDTPIFWGAQNVGEASEGAYTGEISAKMLQDFGCRYVIVGHSERRRIYGEGLDLVAQRFHAALKSGLRPILCVGETLSEREAGQTASIIHEQLDSAISGWGSEELVSLVVAYEPVWAIGTGQTAMPEQVQQVHEKIRNQLMKKDARLAESVRILYGGSVKPENAREILAMDDVDGALVGGASLEAKSFSEIGYVCNS